MKAKIYLRKNSREIDAIEFFEGNGVNDQYVGCVFNPKRVETDVDYRLVFGGRGDNRPFISHDLLTRLSWSGEHVEAHTFMRVTEIEYIYNEA